MKLSFALISLFILVADLFGQENVSPELLDGFFESKTYVVYDSDLFSDYNFYIKDAVVKNWTLTPFELISYETFQKTKANPNASFLVMTDARLANDRSKTTYVFLNLVMGSASNDIGQMPDICNIPLALKEAEQETFVYKLPAFVRLIQAHTQKLKAEPELMSGDLLSIYEKRVQPTASKVILAQRSELAPEINSGTKLKSTTTILAELCSRDQIEKAIENNDDKHAFIHLVGGHKKGALCLKAVIGCGDPVVHYFGYHQISSSKPRAMLKNDFLRISK